MPDLLLYRVREGGLYQDPVGRVVRVVLAPPTEWVMFVEPQTNRVFRMSGFADGNDFNEMVRAYIRTVDRTDSLRLVDSYVALAYAPRSTPVASLYELRRAVEDVLYTARLDDAGITRHVQGWVNKEREAIEGVIEARMLVSDGGGFRARRSLVQVRGSGLRPVIEVHDLTLLVSERGEVRVAADDIVATLDLALQDGVGK